MFKNSIIGILLVLLFWFGNAVVRVESERYALELEACGTLTPERAFERRKCLDTIETRSGAHFHILYALGIL
jgi:hypothetical protein